MLEDASIAIDLGGTIEDTWPQKRSWLASHGFDLGPLPLSRREVIERIGNDEALYQQMVESVYNDKSILNHPLCAGSGDALRNLARNFSIVLLSSRPESQRHVTLKWLCNNAILNLITEVVLVGSNMSKLNWCLRHRISILVDDDIRHLEADIDERKIIRIHYIPTNAPFSYPDQQILVAGTWQDVCRLIWASGVLTGSTAHQASAK